MKKKVGILLLAVIIISCYGGNVANAADVYDYNIASCAVGETYRTDYSIIKQSNHDFVGNSLQINESTYSLYFYVAKTEGWAQATDARWQYSGTEYNYDYYQSYKPTAMYVKLCFRRDTRDTYSGTRRVYGYWANGSY